MRNIWLSRPRKRRYHDEDIETVLKRADAAGVKHIIITAGNLKESRRALQTAQRLNNSGLYATRFYSTVGVHPTNAKQLDERPPAGKAAAAPDACSSGIVSAADDCRCGRPAAADHGGSAGDSHCDSDSSYAPDETEAGDAASGLIADDSRREQPNHVKVKGSHKEEYIASLEKVSGIP